MMNRRELLAAGATVVATGTAFAANQIDKGLHKGKEAVAPYQAPIEKKFKELEDRFDKLEHHHKNLVRVGGMALALSTGIDLAIFL